MLGGLFMGGFLTLSDMLKAKSLKRKIAMGSKNISDYHDLIAIYQEQSDKWAEIIDLSKKLLILYENDTTAQLYIARWNLTQLLQNYTYNDYKESEEFKLAYELYNRVFCSVLPNDNFLDSSFYIEQYFWDLDFYAFGYLLSINGYKDRAAKMKAQAIILNKHVIRNYGDKITY